MTAYVFFFLDEMMKTRWDVQEGRRRRKVRGVREGGEKRETGNAGMNNVCSE